MENLVYILKLFKKYNWFYFIKISLCKNIFRGDYQGASALAANKTLAYLGLYNNKIGEAGTKALQANNPTQRVNNARAMGMRVNVMSLLEHCLFAVRPQPFKANLLPQELIEKITKPRNFHY